MSDSPDHITCGLCHHSCAPGEGKAGVCGTRYNKAGALDIPYYGYVTASSIDPIEKKPLYHWRPGALIPSFGFYGCNLKCPFCQNWQISQRECAGEYYDAADVVRCVSKTGLPQIAYTYSEPLVHAEFLLDCARAAHENNIANVLVTNGCEAADYARGILKYIDAANIDLKCFSREKYKNILGGDLDAVCNFIECAHELGVHIEITTLVVTDFNDSMDEIDSCVNFVSGLSKDIPYHFSAYHPAYKYNKPATSKNFLFEIEKKAKEKLNFVHLGNV
jgi:pyruvate formate lyase activating enzyme